MTEWFHERYISRAEHEEIVAYYAKLVAQLYRQLTDLKTAGIDAETVEKIVAHGRRKVERDLVRPAGALPDDPGANVIVVDFRSRRGLPLPD